MRVNLKPNMEKLQEYIAWVIQYNRECDNSLYHLDEISNLDDVFMPYSKVSFDGLNMVECDYRDDFGGVYVCDLNDHYMIDRLTDYKENRRFSLSYPYTDYGV